MKIRIFIYIICITLTFGNTRAEKDDIRHLKLINRFPTEQQMEQGDFFLGRGTNFEVYKNFIFFCVRFEHEIIQFDLDGNFIRRIGRQGQGPGEFNLPSDLYIYKDQLFVQEAGNRRIQKFTIDGEYKSLYKILIPIYDFIIVKNKVFALSPNTGEALEYGRDNATLFVVYNLDFELINKIKGGFRSSHDNFYMDNTCVLREMDEDIHCLQNRGIRYRIYDQSGALKKEFELEINPFEISEYKKTGYLWAFRTFCIHNNKIYASLAANGKIVIYVFDLNGRFLHKYESEEMENTIYYSTDIRIIRKKGKDYLYMLLNEPMIEFMVFEIIE